MTEQEERGSFSQWFDDVGHGLGLNKAVAWTVWQRAWQARASLAQAGEPVAWRPIEAAPVPTDVRAVMVGWKAADGNWMEDIWAPQYLAEEQEKSANGFYNNSPHLEICPTHWCHLPPPPTIKRAPPAPVGVDAVETSKACVDVLAERRRQVEAEGWTPEHDNEHADGQLAKAAACYAVGWKIDVYQRFGFHQYRRFQMWPWHLKWWKPKDRRHDLVRAAALIIAEIERLDRAALSAAGITDTSQKEG